MSLVITANDVKGASRDQWTHIEIVSSCNVLIDFTQQNQTLLVEDAYKTVQYFEVERRCQQFTSTLPLASFMYKYVKTCSSLVHY